MCSLIRVSPCVALDELYVRKLCLDVRCDKFLSGYGYLFVNPWFGTAMIYSENPTDSTLMQQIAAGSELALEQFYERYKRLVFSLTLGILRDTGAAEEVTLDVFTRIWNQAAGFDVERASVKTWLVSIARHAAIDQLRRRHSRRDQDPAHWAEDALETLPAATNVESEVQNRQQRREIQQAIAELPIELQQVLARAYFNGDTHSQIAIALNQPLGTVKSRIRSAMLQLREKLQPDS